ncbi:hypothetical protein ACQPZX_09155 [Actinoplanes sp. CA-142083]|uniref:hypothetical protein n=1 Tax=Actinoplanes sp. CA-142083 TaxID=3239903 RepID=UPI003D92582B
MTAQPPEESATSTSSSASDLAVQGMGGTEFGGELAGEDVALLLLEVATAA